MPRRTPAIAIPVRGLVTLASSPHRAVSAAVRSGTIDASFRAVTRPLPHPGEGVGAVRVFDEPAHLLTGPAHVFAAAPAITPAGLAGHRIWMPGIVAGTEWAAYYDELAAAFGLTIDVTDPSFGTEPLLDVIASSPALATFVGEQTRLVWPAHYDLRRIAVHGPTPVYPRSLIWRTGNRHPGLSQLRSYLSSRPPAPTPGRGHRRGPRGPRRRACRAVRSARVRAPSTGRRGRSCRWWRASC